MKKGAHQFYWSFRALSSCWYARWSRGTAFLYPALLLLLLPVFNVYDVVTTHRGVLTSIPVTLDSHPSLSTAYSGTIFDVGVAHEKTVLYLRDIHWNQGKFFGEFQGLGKVGTFSGTVTNDGRLRFAVALLGDGMISFQGDTKYGGDLIGEFYSLNVYGQRTEVFGIWNVSAM